MDRLNASTARDQEFTEELKCASQGSVPEPLPLSNAREGASSHSIPLRRRGDSSLLIKVPRDHPPPCGQGPRQRGEISSVEATPSPAEKWKESHVQTSTRAAVCCVASCGNPRRIPGGPPQAQESRPAPPRFQTLSSPNLLHLDTSAGTDRVSLIPTIRSYLRRSFPSKQK